MALNPSDWQGDSSGNYSGVRWSFHLARPPAAMYELSDGAVAWWLKNVYDNAALSDPMGYQRKLIDDWRVEAARRGVRANETDVDVMEYVAAGTFPVPQNAIEAYQAELVSAVRTAPPADLPRNNAGGADEGDQGILNYLASKGVALVPPSGAQYYSGALIAPIPGSDVFNGTANIPDPQYSGPASASAFPIGPGAPLMAVNQGAPMYAATSSGLFGGTGSNQWILLAAAAAAIYLLTKGSK
jgi:hypothetical protein